MSKIILTPEQFDNVKKVLFGNQKQSGVINDAVIHIVGSSLASYIGGDCLNSQQAFKSACENFLQGAIDHNHVHDETLVMLIAGRQSLINLQTEGPKVVSAEYPNPESCKVNFRVLMLGEEAVKETEVVETQQMSVSSEVQKLRMDRSELINLSCYDAACAIRDAILPTVPDTVRSEINDDSLAAIYCAEAYYKFQSETPLRGTVESKVPNKGSVALGVRKFIDKYGADIIRAVYAGYSSYKSRQSVAEKLNMPYEDVNTILDSSDCKQYYSANYKVESEKNLKEGFSSAVIKKVVDTWKNGGSLVDCATAGNMSTTEAKDLLKANGYVIY